MHERLIAPDGRELRGVAAVAGGEAEVQAITAVLQSRLLTGLITDEPTARRTVADFQ